MGSEGHHIPLSCFQSHANLIFVNRKFPNLGSIVFLKNWVHQVKLEPLFCLVLLLVASQSLHPV